MSIYCAPFDLAKHTPDIPGHRQLIELLSGYPFKLRMLAAELDILRVVSLAY